jgi:zinc transport system ATP-binding protein
MTVPESAVTRAEPPAIVLERVSAMRGDAVVLHELSVTITPSCLTAVIGPNGAGKTTLLLAILGLIEYSGSIRYVDSTGQLMTPCLSYVPQSLSFDRQSTVTVLEFMALDLQIRPVWLNVKASVREACEKALGRLDAAHLLKKPIGRLSGGEMQRVLLAKALQRNPQVLLLDEPVSGVDIVGGHLFCDVLEKIQKEQNMTVLMVSHDLSVVSRHANRVLCLNRGLSCEGETPTMLTPEQLFQLYGVHSGLYEHHPKPDHHQCHVHEQKKHDS